ncbi:MAG: hypothetical protein P8K68_12580 [Algibacter sp.]|nr:hypothetical protein [Algibacter sp.]MDG2179602.1 hypothetical protein [Algibacter sp.]
MANTGKYTTGWFHSFKLHILIKMIKVKY